MRCENAQMPRAIPRPTKPHMGARWQTFGGRPSRAGLKQKTKRADPKGLHAQPPANAGGFDDRYAKNEALASSKGFVLVCGLRKVSALATRIS